MWVSYTDNQLRTNNMPAGLRGRAIFGKGERMSDLIDRQALLKQIDIDSDGEPGYYGDTWKFIDTIKNMPNVHDLPKDTDTISRQQAIDGKICIRRSNGVEIYDDYVVPVEYLKQLPPAQPAPSQVAKDIARIVENGQDMRVIAQPERIKGRWIAKEKKNLFRCSKCDAVIYSESEYDRNEFHKFCGRCGADMREVTT